MDRLYAPWRSKYVVDKKSDQCPFCEAAQSSNDECFYILKKTPEVVILLNRYPYNAGHLLIVPHSHAAELCELSASARSEIMESASEMAELLKKALQPDGINMGFNFGKSSGGSIPEHLHFHVLPRWQGDTNFLSTIGDTKLVSFDLDEIYQKLLKKIK